MKKCQFTLSKLAQIKQKKKKSVRPDADQVATVMH